MKSDCWNPRGGVNVFGSLTEIKRELFADGLHPNAEGHRRMADVLCEFLETLKIETPIARDTKGN